MPGDHFTQARSITDALAALVLAAQNASSVPWDSGAGHDQRQRFFLRHQEQKCCGQWQGTYFGLEIDGEVNQEPVILLMMPQRM